MDPLDFVVELAHRAGVLLCERFDQQHDVTEKRPHDLVTEADHASEALIVAAVRASFPDAVVFAEEGGVYGTGGDERFIVDPLDGTTNYAHRYPLFCVSIAYERNGVLEAAAIDAPLMGMRFAARRGGGATLNGAPIRPSTVSTLAGSLVGTGFNPTNYERNGPYFAAMSHHAQGVRRDGSAALDLALVASGRFEAFWEFDLKPWDVAAGVLIVTEAGGRISQVDGSPHALTAPSVAASNGRVHAEFCSVLCSAE